MADREKLVNIIDTACEGYAENLMQPYGAEVLADYLIANGVRISPWISVKDRLPEYWTPVMVYFRHRYTPNDGYSKIRIIMRSEEFGWAKLEKHYEITHWMPLPEPPKED